MMNSKLFILSMIFLSFFNQLVICSEGVFQIHIKKYTLFSTLNLTKCCANFKNSTKSCPNDCNIFMEICLSVYQENPHRYACDIGETVIKTDILGNDKLNEISKRDYSITVKERWQTDFNILVKIKHRNLANKKDILIVTLSSSERDVKPSSSWITKQLSTPKDHFQLNVSFRYFCSQYYHGEKCDKLCKPSANERGFYNCSSNGERICHAGYSGVYCDQVVCSKKCIHGTCVGPNQCRCLTGWGGNSCDKCIPYPGCIHGGCRLDENTKELLPLTCQCKKKWGGMFCNIDLNYCANNPNVCENGGECQNFGNITTNQQYRCICKPGFKGAHCEKVEANCLIRKCLNGGQCEIDSHNNQSKCKCQESFYGDRCQFNQTSCDDNPCVSKNSVCFQDKQNGFKCKCSKGFTGRNCEIDVDECSNKPCSNGGMCIDRTGGFLCVCPVGFSGDRCQVNKNDCQKLSCMNGAKCMDKANRIDCECTTGWTGNLCDQNINECAINQPCLNKGRCIDTPGSYKCLCEPLWSGKHCNLKIVNPNKNPNEKRCTINPCGQNGICLISSKLSFGNSQTDDIYKTIEGPYKCKCNPGFTGELCEKVIIANGSIINYSDSQVTTIPFIYRNQINNRPMTLILLIIIAIGVPTIIVIIVSFLCCSKCHRFNKTKSDYQKNCKNESIIERTNIKILNNKLHRNQKNLYLSNNEKIPLSMTKLNNELVNNETCIPRYQCSHNIKMSNVPFCNYQCHISSLPSQLLNSNNNNNNNNNNKNQNNHIGSQLNSNLMQTKIHSINSKENDEKYFHKSLSSVRDGEPESQYQNSIQIKSIDKDIFQSSMDLEHYEKSNYKSSKGFNSAMLYRKSNSNLTQDLCSSHNSLLDAALKQNLRTAVSQQFSQPNILPIVENEDCNYSGKSFNSNSRTSLTTTQTINLAWPIIDCNLSKNPSIISNHTNPSSSDNRMIIYNSRSMKPQKLNYNLISHPHFKETSCFFDSNLNFSSIKSNKTDSTLIDDYSSTKM